MARQPGKIRYSNSNCNQDIFGFICNYVLSYSKPDQKYIVKYCIDHLLIYQPQETKPQIVDHVYTHTLAKIPVRHEPCALSPFIVEILISYKPFALPPIPTKIPNRYKPLDLPPILHDLPANYTNNLPRFDGENANITAEKHIQRFKDFLDLYEVEVDDVYIRMFALSLQGKVKN
jgi:hypothetical protein